jgi:hypothetical protein
MKRKILLLEPNYQNKYPPIGLMKISTYHKMIGDDVTFFKGDLLDFVIDKYCELSLRKLKLIDKRIEWRLFISKIKKFIRDSDVENILAIPMAKNQYAKVIALLSKYSSIIRKREYEKYPKYDRVYVTTLFTFYWNITIQTIQFSKRLVRNEKDIYVGGVMASLLTKEIEAETNIKPFTGLLDVGGVLDNTEAARNLIIDDLPLDYSILDEIRYKYPTQSAYFTFMTKGCTRKCAFCSVPKLEPTYKPKILTIDKFNAVKDRFGDQRNLLLMDNNVLASPFFPEIIEEIKSMGFTKGATFVEPNQYEIAIKNLKSGYNNRAFMSKIFFLIHSIRKRIKGRNKIEYERILNDFNLLEVDLLTRKNLLSSYRQLAPIYEKFRSKAPKLRYVDFNQGTDARYVTDQLMKLMSEIPIHPLRIAFDYIGLKETYIKAVELAAKYGINNLSNYILYNFNDTPDDFYERLKINVQLGQRLGVKIHSFPMKFIPLFGEEAKGREFVGKKWNKKFIRAVQSILNVTKGIVAPGPDFFYHAFGSTLSDFYELLYMPEEYIVYRRAFESEFGFTHIWKNQFRKLMASDRADIVKSIIIRNDFTKIQTLTSDLEILELLKHYTLKRTAEMGVDSDVEETKRKFDQIIKKDQFIELTLTYDFENA